MCGICGILSSHNPADQAALLAMTQRLAHRGPDHCDIYIDGRLGLGHTRLSIIDLSLLGNQPMSDKEGKVWIVYNGEIYNFLELRKNLEREGVTFHSRTDTEVIIYFYKKYGVDCLRHLRGMFAFCIWDSEKERVFLARDRLGQKPLVYAQTPQGFLFASEINALAAHPAVSREIDLEALDLYLSLQFIPAPWTIYKAIRKLPPAHYALVTPSGIRIERYWRLEYTRKRQLSEEGALEAVLEKLTEAVRLRLISDVPVGALLSGGVDSSLIVALMSQLSDRPVQTFSIGFGEEGFNELPHARRVARHLGTDHYEEVLEPNVLEVLPRIARQYGEPYADKSAVPSFYVAQMARRHVTVALNGDGGDELAAGYWRYQLPPLAGLVSRLVGHKNGPVPDMEQADRLLNGVGPPHRLRRFWEYRYAHPEIQSLLYSDFWNERQKQSLLRPEVLDEVRSTALEWKQRWADAAGEYADTPIGRMMWIDNHTYLPGDLLVKMDIASMAYSLEARSPLLDHELVELCASLPDSLKVRNGETKYLLKKLAERFLPKDVLYRPKQGFSLPVSDWLRGPMADFTRDTLLDEQSGLDNYFRMDTVSQIMERHINGEEEHGYRLWVLLNLALWRQQVERSQASHCDDFAEIRR